MSGPDLDRLLDDAIAGYVTEPAPGLERRVLARLSRRRWWPAVGFVAAAAGLALVWFPPRQVEKPVSATVVKTVVKTVAKAGSTIPVAPRQEPPMASATKAQPKAVESIPLSRGERRLLEFAQSHAQLLQKPVLWDEPVTVPALAAAPLAIQPLDELVQ
jgi:hypothetical protein